MIRVKAIETDYAGCRFRSRLEARWAVFYDKLGIKWEYEKQGYELESGRYLPDFWLPKLEYFIEIKGKQPTDHEEQLCMDLARVTEKRVYLFYGDIPMDPSIEYQSAFIYAPSEDGSTWGDVAQWWCECPHCGRLEIQFDGRADRINCNCPRSGGNNDKGYNSLSDRIVAAYKAARSARFEFGGG